MSTIPTSQPLQIVHTPTSVYRYYDAAGLLLYVGVTSRGSQRNREHNASKAWWQFVVRQEVSHHPDRDSALTDERLLIERYRPAFNVQHNPGHELVQQTYLAYAAGTFADDPGEAYRACRRFIPLDHLNTAGYSYRFRSASYIPVTSRIEQPTQKITRWVAPRTSAVLESVVVTPMGICVEIRCNRALATTNVGLSIRAVSQKPWSFRIASLGIEATPLVKTEKEG